MRELKDLRDEIARLQRKKARSAVFKGRYSLLVLQTNTGTALTVALCQFFGK